MSESPVASWGNMDDEQLGQRIGALRTGVEPTDVDLVVNIRAALDSVTAAGPPRRSRVALVVAAVVILLAGVIVLAIAPARTALADWLGIGSTSIGLIDELPEADRPTPPSTPPGIAPGAEPIRAAVSEQLGFEVQLPDEQMVGQPIGWEIRGTGAGTELIVAWDGFTLTARSATNAIPVTKFATSADVVSAVVTTNGDPALWIEDPHIRAAADVVELVGNTLIWVSDGVEYRVSGDLTQSEATTIASSLG